MDYLIDQISIPSDPDFYTWTQPFNSTYAETREISVTGPEGEDVEVYSLLFNHPTPIPDGITADLVALPVDDNRGQYQYISQSIYATNIRRFRMLC